MIEENKDLNWLIQNFTYILQSIGLSEETVRNYYPTWLENNPNGDIHDYMWFMMDRFRSQVENHAPEGNIKQSSLSEVYLLMADYQRKALAKPANAAYRKHLYHNVLRNIEEDYATKIKVVSRKCCDYCNSFNNQVFSVKQILKEQPLASPECTNPNGCSCKYDFSIF